MLWAKSKIEMHERHKMGKIKDLVNGFLNFLKRKDIEFSDKRYLYDALSSMALGLFSSLIIGLIIRTVGEQAAILFGDNLVFAFMAETGGFIMSMMGPAVGAAVAFGLKAPPLVIFASVATGGFGALAGGPAGAFLAAAVGAEFGKAVSKETKVDIIVTPALTVIMGCVVAKLFGPALDALLKEFGQLIMNATELKPFLMGITVSVIVGLLLTAPVSSAAICIMIDLSGLAAGAATVGCCAQMIGFAVISYKANGIGGSFAQGLGTSMLQVPNIIRKSWILVPPTLTAAILGPLSTIVFGMTNIPAGAGMGSSGLVGQIGTFTSMGFTPFVLLSVLLLHFVLPAVLALLINAAMKRLKKIEDKDYYLEV
jgi:uncharacterized membrane protein